MERQTPNDRGDEARSLKRVPSAIRSGYVGVTAALVECEETTMGKDQQGLTLAGSRESAAAFDRALADYYGLTGDPVGALKPALARDRPSFWAASPSPCFT